MDAMLTALLLLATPISPLTVSELKVELVRNPMNVDVLHPRLGWMVTSPDEGQRETGYRILVSSSSDLLARDRGDLWDTGKVASSNTIEIPYTGKALHSTEHVFWKVQAWDRRGKSAGWSAPGEWTMGLLDPGDWKAKWICADRANLEKPTLFFRKEFKSPKQIRRALCFVSGLGQYEMWLNGDKVGKNWLTPGWTQYAKTILADSYDVTSQLKLGVNSLALHVGNGMYNMSGDARGGQQLNSLGPKMAICQLMIDYADGTSQTVITDSSWKCSPSPETYSGVYGGEDWDARLDQPGWRLSGFNDHNWKSTTLAKPIGGVLRGLTHANPPLRLMAERYAVETKEPKPNTLVLNLGQNAPYIPQIQVQGKPGDVIKLWPAELLKPDGTVDQRTMRSGKLATYTLRGGSPEEWHPSFWYVGSQFWQIQAWNAAGQPIEPRTILRQFKGLMVHADIEPVGTFSCSNTLFNKTHDLIWWAMRSNFASVISDCPHREKSGWLEEDHLVGNGLMYSFDMGPMFRKVIQDMTDTQLPNGMVPTMAPEYFLYDGGFRDSVEWGGSYLLLPEMMQSWYGKQGLVAEHYATMKKYVDYLGTKAKNGILSNGLGDWDGAGTDPRTPVGITDTAYYFALTRTLAKFARSVGKPTDAKTYSALAESIRLSFLHAFFDRTSGKVGNGSQSGQATALDLDLIDKADIPRAFDQLLADVASHQYGVSCGEVGHPSLLRVLTKYGRADLVAKIHLQVDRPGYGYQIKRGLTTLAECWDASPNSYNHFMLGHIMEWLYGDLVGIRPDPAGVAYSKSIIRPTPVPGVVWAKGTYKSSRGTIAAAWKLNGAQFHLDVTIPANTSATIFVPARTGSSVRLSYPLTRAFGVFLSQRPVDGYESIRVNSGRYAFDSIAP